MDKLFSGFRLISDFNLSNLAAYLRNELAAIEINLAPYGQVMPQLTLAKGSAEVTVVWTRPEGVLPCFSRVLQHEAIKAEVIMAEVDEYARALSQLAERVKLVCVASWTYPAYQRGKGLLDLKEDSGLARLLLQMNLRLAERVSSLPNVFLLDAQRWIAGAGRNGFSPKLWYMAKIPFGNDVFKEATADIIACLQALSGRTRKLLLVDLDETLWGGVLGEVGWEKIRLGGHDYAGEAYVDFQKALKALANRGVLLGIISKNDERVVLNAFDNHPDMVLRLEDFAGWKINWQDKAQNILELVAELNLGLQSVVFIDDHPVERARVREALPEVLVPEWPGDCMLYASTLQSLRCFDAAALSEEDFRRTRMYVSEKQRGALKHQTSDLDEWLKKLDITVRVEELNEANLQRATQLLNKTNQMNLSTRRMTEREFMYWAQQPGRATWVFRVEDRFGDAGLTGIVSVEWKGDKCHIVDFLLSCRVMGRKVEEAMLHMAVDHAMRSGASVVVAEYIPTEKNRPCLDFWSRCGFGRDGEENVFVWYCRNEFPSPDVVRLERAEVVA